MRVEKNQTSLRPALLRRIGPVNLKDGSRVRSAGAREGEKSPVWNFSTRVWMMEAFDPDPMLPRRRRKAYEETDA